jgi:SAM-dependent methyltransferase
MMTLTESRAWRPEIKGWSDDILPFLRDFLVPRLPPAPICVEIGVYHGRSALFLIDEIDRQGKLYSPGLDTGKVAHLYGVDLAESDATYSNGDPLALGAEPGPDAAGRLTYLTCGSELALAQIGLADYIFLDGDHRYGPLRLDVINWLRHLRIGGWICGHDYGHPQFPGVKHVVDRLTDRQEVLIFGSVWAWHPSHGAGARMETRDATWKDEATSYDVSTPPRPRGRRAPPPPAEVPAFSRTPGGQIPKTQHFPEPSRRR